MVTVKHIPAPNNANAPSYQRTTVKARAFAFIRKVILDNRHIDLAKIRADDQAFINQKLDEANAAGQYPQGCSQGQDYRDFRKEVKKCIRQLFQVPKELPYRLEHCEEDGKYAGIGLVLTKSLTTDELATAFTAHEGVNSELAWSRLTVKQHDSCFNNRWVETSKEGTKGLYWKNRWREAGRAVGEGQIGYQANFLIYGRLMFANHDDDGHFLFQPFQPITPIVKGHVITGKVTIAPQDEDKGRMLQVGDQILVYYDDEMDFEGQPGFKFRKGPAVDTNGEGELGERVEEQLEEEAWDAEVLEMVDDMKNDSDFEFGGSDGSGSDDDEKPKRKKKAKGKAGKNVPGTKRKR
ncbi:hypothetical protein QFC21_007337 [Naganishia friedmannii]|uniref:Uncharacterized protein n=1 Tax=Naganishia friedmannii TaxID=89922 RepID=A0ACC2UVE0_9TREE|nr:hypothetical protein QFC21_007337 [Naganishia friedmannii]